MKKIYPFILLGFANLFQAQSQDLEKLATGENVQFNAIYDKKGEQVEGYFTLYDQGKTDNDQKKKFEYIFLDKNLNVVVNKEFVADKTVASYVAYTNVRGKLTLSPRLVYNYLAISGGAKAFVPPSDKEVDLTTNEMKDRNEKCYEQGKLIDCPFDKTLKESRNEVKEERKKNGFVERSQVWETKYDTYLVMKYDDYDSYTKNDKLSLYTPDAKEIWSFDYNKGGTKKFDESLRILSLDEDKIISILRRTENKTSTFSLVILDIKTGNILKKQELEPLLESLPNKLSKESTLKYLSLMYTQTGDLSNSKNFDDKFIMVGRAYEASEVNYYNLNGNGYVRMIVDKKSLDVSFKMFDYVNDLIKYIPAVKDGGKLESSYYLAPRAIYLMKDGGVGILTEMYKDEGAYSANKNKDFYYIYTDENFKLIGAKMIPKEVSKFSSTDYLFAQNIKGGDDVVFFYKDLVKNADKKKVVNLYINTLIKNQFKQEVIPIGTEENTIVPYVAKEGYILLNEYNKKEKYNQVRLEKLNY
ncbi:DUF6770 family protein [Soonwooa sp.]|uniref:DUF6770 family protein n=1 Tax=Soonwooa sp. TaxID=1938592 RepID=UPI002607F81A|nr:DUF6770 family protein [Soonwooa sp.]